MMGLLSASSPNAWGFGTSSALPHAAPNTTSATAPAYAAARPAIVVIRCICMIGLDYLDDWSWRGLEARLEPHAEYSRRGLHQESVIEDEGLRAAPVHVRIDAVAVVPPHDVLPGQRDRRRPGAHPGGEARRDVPRNGDLTQTHVVALVGVVQDRRVLPDRIGLERGFAVGA